jgi:hypothetical protein
MPNIYDRVRRDRAIKALTPQLGASTVPKTARNRRSQVMRQLSIAQMLNLRKRGAGGGFGLFEMMFGGGIFGGPGWPPGGGGGGGDNGDDGGPGGPGPGGGGGDPEGGIGGGGFPTFPDTASNIITTDPPSVPG